MKRWTALFIGTALSVALTACGNNEVAEPYAKAASTTAPVVPVSSAPAAEQASAGVPTLDELLQKTAEAGAELKSFSTKVHIKQIIVIKEGETTQEQGVETTADTEYTTEPLEMHQVVVVKNIGQDEQQIEQYITEEGFFTLMNGQWMRMSAETTEQMKASTQESAHPEKTLEKIKDFAGQTTITEEGDNYLIRADVSGNSMKILAQSLLNQGRSLDQQMSAADQTDIKSMTLVYTVDKNTYYLKQADLNVILDMTTGEQTVSMDMMMSSTISDHNQITEITVPQEVLDALEVQMPEKTQ